MVSAMMPVVMAPMASMADLTRTEFAYSDGDDESGCAMHDNGDSAEATSLRKS
jgi:hypothetical protein